jgi:hypothetical protein
MSKAVGAAAFAWLITAVYYFYLNFTFSALPGPVFGWILVSVSGGAPKMNLEHYQTAFEPLLYGVGLAIVLTFCLKETGPAVRRLAA